MELTELIAKAEEKKALAYEKYAMETEKDNVSISLTSAMQYYMDLSNIFLKLIDDLKKLDLPAVSNSEELTKKEILIKTLNDRCNYESSKEMDYDTHLAIMDAMDEFAQQQVKKLHYICSVSNMLCCICNNQLTHFELEHNICVKCGNSPCPIAK